MGICLMKRIAIISIFVFWGIVSMAQSNDNRRPSRFSFGVSFSPDYTYRNFRTGDEKLNGIVDGMNDIESQRFGFTTGLAGKYKLSRRLVLESGVLFSDKGNKVEFSDDYWISPEEVIDPGFSGPDPALPSELTIKYHYYYIGVPLKVNYRFLDKKVKVFLSGGISTDFYIDTKVQQISIMDGDRNRDISHPDNENIGKINFVGLAGVGLEYSVSSNFHLRFEPIFRYSFTQMFKDGDIDLDTNLYSIGANFAIYFQK